MEAEQAPVAPASDEARKKDFKIIVNAQEKVVAGREVTFEEIVQLAFPGGPQGDNWTYTVAYRGAVAPKHEGTLVKGGKVEVKDGTIFDVTQTNKS